MQITGRLVSQALLWKLMPVAPRISLSSGLTELRIGRRFSPRHTSRAQPAQRWKVDSVRCMTLLPILVEGAHRCLGQVQHRQALGFQGLAQLLVDGAVDRPNGSACSLLAANTARDTPHRYMAARHMGQGWPLA